MVKYIITDVYTAASKNFSPLLHSGQVYLIKVTSNTPVKCIIGEPKPSTKTENQSMSNTAERIKDKLCFSPGGVKYASENGFFEFVIVLKQ